ncbi:MAG: adenine deaminase [Deltaproteobacteria bacterium]|nr:adenine deaminase [Deltaproteobacteria bacterium]MBW1930529.1 adenine deaminase [Deltaproteobacteria bacterium]MBW2025925.1 adenine deaminase [Deltaproteobacteria bacterium]MBW2125707.1 adenine deaminase [Deltaproteobacteria bacterium]RLB22224.1 MAG: adenine deaminase [Deltaproteobacteria bacterium]
MEDLRKILKKRIQVAKKEIPADLVLKGGWVTNLFTGELVQCDIAIFEGFIAAVGKGYEGTETKDLHGKVVAPGLIDAHIHIESSMLHPRRLAEALLPCGTTTIISDPHEIANVAGLEGIDFMMKETEDLPFDIFFMAPSCVPSSHLETSGAELGSEELASLRGKTRVLGLAEVMNYPGILGGEEDLLKKILLFRDFVIDGHCPKLRGEELQAYISAGIRSDHECTEAEEALEKVSAGMMVMIREGTSAKNLQELIPLVKAETISQFCLVSDDLHPHDILHRGHINHLLRKAIHLGLDPISAVRLATLNPARFFRLTDRGAIAPGYRGDLVVFEDLRQFNVDVVIKNGKEVVSQGTLLAPLTGKAMVVPSRLRAMNMAPLDPKGFKIPCQGMKVRVIELIPGQILTSEAVEEVEAKEGELTSDTNRDLLKIAVVERHKATGRIGLGMVRGFGLKRGALASSVAHDSHNVIVVGVSDEDLYQAVEELRDMGGGLVVVADGTVLGRVPLPVAGLMSMDPLESVARQADEVRRAAGALGCRLEDPFMALSFLALPVIPELRVTDLGLIDVKRFEIVPLFV